MESNSGLKCTRCGKLSAKASSLKRHEYYCRSKPAGQSRSRKRTCEACTRAKIRCDAAFPSCSSCSSRQIVCQYADHALPNLAYSSDALDSSLVLQVSANNDQAFGDAVDAFAMDPFAVDVATSSQATFYFNNPSTTGLLDIFDANAPLKPPGTCLGLADPSDHVSNITAEYVRSRSVSPISLQWKPPRVLGQRIADTPRTQMASMMLGQIIASFPFMMTQSETFPPFIHPRCYDYSTGSTELPEILKDCMGLAHMFRTKRSESEKIFWRSIRMEQEKLFAQHATYSNYELLAAAQAIIIYTAMRLTDKTSGYEEVEIPLLHSLNIICGQLNQRIGWYAETITVDHGKRDWQDWLFAESRRRIVTVARIMNTAFYMDRAFSCDGLRGFALLPLPATRLGWEATNENVWCAEYDKCKSEGFIYGLTTEGKLVRLRQANGGVEIKDQAWQEWLAGMDAFGTLTMLASHLLA